MPLHITKIAFGATSIDDLRQRLQSSPEIFATTRYLPKRQDEMAGGSLFWIFEHALIGRSPILGFSQRDDGRHNIRLEPGLIMVEPRAKRAHQGWRYLKHEDAPPDLGEGVLESDVMPGRLVRELSKLGLV